MADRLAARAGLIVPVAALSIFAVATGFLMSLLPLSLPSLGLSPTLAAAVASAYYGGLLIGAIRIEPVVRMIGHRRAFLLFLAGLIGSVAVMALLPNQWVWLVARFLGGMATAGVFVVVESWLLLADDERARARRLALYMGALYGGNALGQLFIGPVGVEGMWPFGLIIAMLLAAMVPLLLVKQGAPRLQEHHRMGFRSLKYLSRTAIWGCIISGLILGPLYGLLPVFLRNHGLTSAHVGELMALVVLGGLVVQPLVSWMTLRLSRTLCMGLFCLLGLAGALILARTPFLSMAMLALLMLGAAAFALYPIAIAQACQGQENSKIVSITELMLLCYSIGSVTGPFMANWGDVTMAGLPMFFMLIFAASALYMLAKAISEQMAAAVKPPLGMD
ncbi:MFS transporter [Ferrimonas senticii]|uniref:MFS transporter n=1 Tax=Ferrimonas senticii TaxID=394566 RepID=UPI0004292613|nr:MFS transporter [Ferrimonas senticii]